MTSEDQARLADAAVRVVLRAGLEERLITREEVLAALLAEGFFPEAQGQIEADPVRQTSAQAKALAAVSGALARHPGVASFQSLSGQTVFHCPELLSRTYARILDRKGSALLLIAEEIRANSRDYPRPLPVELFQERPFALTPEEIERTLGVMAAHPDYQDITFTSTSSGAVYLFSTLHLERGYAEFLAQRAESLAMNP